ncbi:unnamed protein product [Rhizoctonia solani]|uniref:H-type lectin domain-containing protein n=1 Tax=Rhizoctonia solani TaxID=456999 RepID=A0A8H3E7G4_9AGAM|nr:unnamed protein product [Rhizoctonia solani]
MPAYTYNTNDDPKSLTGRGVHNSETFETHFPAKNIPLGLTMIDIPSGAHYGISSYIDGVEPVDTKSFDDFYATVHLDASDDTISLGAGCTWLDVSKWDLEFQFGTQSIKGHMESFWPEQDFPITFDRPFEEVPKIVIWVHSLNTDGDRAYEWNVVTHAEDVTTTGFKLRMESGGTNFMHPELRANIYKYEVSWVAVPQGWPNVATGSCEVCKDGKPLPEYKKEVKFDKSFKRTPRVIVALNKISTSNEHGLRIGVSAEDVTPEGMTLSFKTWDECVIYKASAEYIAIVD